MHITCEWLYLGNCPIQTKPMPAPLKASLFNVTELHNGSFIPAQLNLDPNNKYSYKDSTFRIHFRTATGVVKGDEYYLLFTTQSNQIGAKELLEFNVKKKEGNSWSDDKETTQKLVDKWIEDGCLVSVEVSSHPQLKALVKVLAEKKVIVNNEFQCVVGCTQEQADKLYQDWSTCIDYLLTTETPNSNDAAYQLIMQLFQAKQYLAVYKSNDELPKKVQVTPFGSQETGEFQSVPFKGTLPHYDEVVFEAPKKWEGGGSRGSTTVNGYMEPDTRLQWVKGKLADPEFVAWANTITSQEQINALSIAMAMTGVSMAVEPVQNDSKKNIVPSTPLMNDVPISLPNGLPVT